MTGCTSLCLVPQRCDVWEEVSEKPGLGWCSLASRRCLQYHQKSAMSIKH